MPLTDQRGLTIQVADPAAVAVFEQALKEVVTFRGDPVATLDQAVHQDDGFVLAHCLSAMVNTIGNASSRLDDARESIAAARQVAHGTGERERWHLGAVEAWFDGELSRASSVYQQILFQYPRDLMALFAAHWLDFYRGDAQALRGRVGRVLSAWDESVPGYHWLLGMHAFGLEEMGQYHLAETSGRRAVELDPTDAWAVHAVAHVMEMEGRLEEGVRWLDDTSSGWASSNIKIHNWWHKILYLIDLGDLEQVLEIYDHHVVDTDRDDVEALIDRVGALARLSLLDIDVGDRWQALAPLWVPVADDARYPFNDLHALICFRYAGQDSSATTLMQAIEGGYGESNLMMTVGRSVLKGVDDFCCGRNSSALEYLVPVLFCVSAIGGSHAQRDLVQQLTLEAAIRAGQWPIARALLAERAGLRKTVPHAFTVHTEGRIQLV